VLDCLGNDKCDRPKCQGLDATILPQPSLRLWFNLQLVTYLSFLFFCVWIVKEEAREKLHVLVAIKKGAIYSPKASSVWHQLTVNLLAPAFLMALSFLYCVCLWKDKVDEQFLVFSSLEMLNAWKIHQTDLHGTLYGLTVISSTASKVLAWYCDSFFDKSWVAMSITYSLDLRSSLPAALVQGLFFGYQCYRILSRQKRIYDFIDGDVLLHRPSNGNSKEVGHVCSYWSLLNVSTESRMVMDRADVDEVLYSKVYLPFLQQAYTAVPGLVSTVLCEEDAELLMESIATTRCCRHRGRAQDEIGLCDSKLDIEDPVGSLTS